jgi:hypothetical protein
LRRDTQRPEEFFPILFVGMTITTAENGSESQYGSSIVTNEKVHIARMRYISFASMGL